MKKTITIVAGVTAALALTACGSDYDDTDLDTSTYTQVTPDATDADLGTDLDDAAMQAAWDQQPPSTRLDMCRFYVESPDLALAAYKEGSGDAFTDEQIEGFFDDACGVA